MLNVYKFNTEYQLSKEIKERLEKEIDILSSLDKTIYFKVKVFNLAYYINFIIHKSTYDANIDDKDKDNGKNLPDYITFLVIIDYTYPTYPPKILAKTNFYYPNLMDGRDLSNEVLLNWKPEHSLIDIANSFPIFLKKILTTKSYHYYGKFHIGAVYDLKNFNNMLVNTFTCKFELTTPKLANKSSSSSKSDEGDFLLILTDDTLLLFQLFENKTRAGKIIFWSTLYSIIDIQINKQNKIVSIHLYSEEKAMEKTLRLHIQNVLFFREALVKRMSNLKVKIETMKMIKGQQQERRLTTPEINTMSIIQMEQHIKFLENKIQHSELSYYVINTYSILCGKVIEYYSSIDNDKHMEILSTMKDIFSREDVKKIANENH